jgi:hypothetical protein
MSHFGQIILCCCLSGATKIELLGDRNQIPFINRLGKYNMECETIKYPKKITYLDTSYTMPISACAALLKHYPKGLKTKNLNTKKMEKKFIRKKQDIPYDSLTQYLTFTQFDKLELINLGFHNAMTVHEVQGGRFDKVALCRLDHMEDSIYNSIPHAIVGISRHKDTFIYYTAGSSDAVSDFIKESEVAKNLRTVHDLSVCED